MNAACRAIRPLLSAYMDNEVSPTELRAIGEHVATCAECAAVLAEYREMRALVRALPQPLPPGNLQGAVFARATPICRRRAAWIEFGQRSIAIGALAVALIAIVLTGSLVMRQSAVGAGIAAFDKTPPLVVAWDPAPGNANSRLNQPVRITFSEPMNEGSVLAALRIGLSPADDTERARLLASAHWEGTTLILGEQGSLQPDTDYTIDLDPNVARDTAGNALHGMAQGYSFRTTDVIALASPVTAPVVAPTATPEPTPQPAPTKAWGGGFPAFPIGTPDLPTATTTPRPTPTATQAPAIAQPQPTQAQAVPNNPAPVPTATPVPPTAAPQPTPQPTVAPTATAPPTPQPTQAPTVIPTTPPTVAPTATIPAPTATAAPPSPTSTPKLPFEVAGGFGQIYTRNGPVRDRIGLPVAAEAKVGGTYQLFEGGMMFWREDTATIYVLFAGEPGIWYAFADGWATGMEPGGGTGPATGQFKPQRGFGKVWREQPDVQKRLGYALSADEIGTTLVIQPFEHGLMVWTTASGKPMISVLYENNTYERYEDVSK